AAVHSTPGGRSAHPRRHPVHLHRLSRAARARVPAARSDARRGAPRDRGRRSHRVPASLERVSRAAARAGGEARAPPRAPVVTVYTKADLAASSTDLYRLLPTSTVAVSAITGQGLEDLLSTLRAQLPESPFHYDPDAMATQPMRFFAAEFVREAAFELLHEELPYSVAGEIDEFREGQEPVYIRAVIYVERASQKGIVIGDGGRSIKAIGQDARAKVED